MGGMGGMGGMGRGCVRDERGMLAVALDADDDDEKACTPPPLFKIGFKIGRILCAGRHGIRQHFARYASDY